MMSNNYTNISEFLLDESFQNFVQESNSEDVEFWEKWKRQNPDKLDLLNEAAQIISFNAVNKRKVIQNEAANEVFVRLETQIKQSRKPHFKSKSSVSRIIQIAAIVLLLVGIGSIYRSLFHSDNKIAEQFVEVTTTQNQHRQVNLPDGSVIQLNSNTKLSYPEKFNSSNRKVTLYGEAFFTIQPNSKSPFLVNLTDSICVTVTGTSFNVINYHENAEIEVVLLEGTLQLSIKSKKSDYEQKLKPSEKGVYNKLHPHKNFRIAKIDQNGISEVTAWLRNELFFNNATFEKIANELENEYDIPIFIDDDGLKGVTFTGKFSTEESVFKVLETITHTEPFVYEMKNGEIHISRKN